MSVETNNKTLQYINEYYDSKESKFKPESLFEMIEQAMEATKIIAKVNPEIIEVGIPGLLSEEEEKKFNVKKFMSTALSAYQVPSSQAGKAGTEERKKFQFHIASQIGKKGGHLTEKIKAINLFVDGSSINADASIATILSHCGTLSILQQMVENFNASAAGFAFEAFLAALLSGVQIDDPVGGSLPIEDAILYMNSPSSGEGGTPVSLKLLNSDTAIEGSIENLLTFLGETKARNNEDTPYIEYIVAIKHTTKHLGFNSFVISTNNFFAWIQRDYFDWDRVKGPRKRSISEAEEEDAASSVEVDKLQVRVDKWKALLRREYFPYWGFTDSVRPDSTNYEWYIPSPKRDAKSPEAKLTVIKTAMDREKDFIKKQGLWSDLPEEYYFSDEEKNTFIALPTARLKKSDVAFINNMLEKLKGRQKYFTVKIKKHGRGTELSPVSLNLLHTALGGGKSFRGAETDSERAGEKYLKRLLKRGDYDKWSEVLKGALKKKKNQFSIPNEDVTQGKRSDTEHYGTLKIDQKMIEKILKIYSKKLLILCAPIYEILGELTDNINKFFLGKNGKKKAEAAINASKNANELSVHAGKLKDEKVEE